MTSGVVFTNNELYYHCSDGIYNKKKIDCGSIMYKDLIDSIITIKKKLVSLEIRIDNKAKGLYVVIPITQIDSEKMIELEAFFNDFIEGIPEEAKKFEREYELQKIEAFVNSNNNEVIKKYVTFFDKYDSHGGSFQMTWSWSGFFFGYIYLLHRKAYLELLLYFLVTIVFAVVLAFFNLESISILFWIFHGIVTPYFVYRKFKRIEKRIELQTSEPYLKLKNYSSYGGTNFITSMILSLIGLG